MRPIVLGVVAGADVDRRAVEHGGRAHGIVHGGDADRVVVGGAEEALRRIVGVRNPLLGQVHAPLGRAVAGHHLPRHAAGGAARNAVGLAPAEVALVVAHHPVEAAEGEIFLQCSISVLHRLREVYTDDGAHLLRHLVAGVFHRQLGRAQRLERVVAVHARQDGAVVGHLVEGDVHRARDLAEAADLDLLVARRERQLFNARCTAHLPPLQSTRFSL